MAADKSADRVSVADEVRPASASRRKILEAAALVAVRDGLGAVTLDAVAKEAKISKGGLLYHFRSKDDLIAAMLEDFCATTVARIRDADCSRSESTWTLVSSLCSYRFSDRGRHRRCRVPAGNVSVSNRNSDRFGQQSQLAGTGQTEHVAHARKAPRRRPKRLTASGALAGDLRLAALAASRCHLTGKPALAVHSQ